MTEGIHLDENLMEAPTSRRKFLAGSAAALAGGALMAVPGAALAKGDGYGENKHGRVTDVDILNYALTLEYLEATFYTQGLNKFDKGDFERYFKNNPPKQQGIKELDGGAVYEEFETIREHEQTHVK